MYFEINENGKIMICSEEKFRETAVELAPPDAFSPDEMHDWKVVDGEFVYEPMPKTETPLSDSERIAALEEKLRAAEILLGLEV